MSTPQVSDPVSQTTIQKPTDSFSQNLPLSARMVVPQPIISAKTKLLNEKFELMRSRNWITDRMVEQTQYHFHCTREEALEKLIGVGEPASV
jgi:hypothetical protein